MVALRLTKLGLVMGIVGLGLLAGCQSNKPAPKHDLPAVEAAPAPKPAFTESAPPPAVPATSVELPPATEPQPVDVTLNPDHSPARHAAKPKAEAKPAKAAAFTGKRDRSQWYLVIASANDHAKYLDEYAAYLNSHGVSVTVEKRGAHYAVLSTQGFANATTAEARALKAKVQSLGKEYPEARQTKKALWQDAYFLPPHSGKTGASTKAATRPSAKK